MDTLNERPIAFPDVKTLAELFTEVKPGKGESPVIEKMPNWTNGKRNCYLTGWLSVSGETERRSFHVKPTEAVIACVRDSMLHGEYDRIHFEAVVWDDGRALVLAQYNQIIGSRYLAVIDAASIPAEAE